MTLGPPQGADRSTDLRSMRAARFEGPYGRGERSDCDLVTRRHGDRREGMSVFSDGFGDARRRGIGDCRVGASSSRRSPHRLRLKPALGSKQAPAIAQRAVSLGPPMTLLLCVTAAKKDPAKRGDALTCLMSARPCRRCARTLPRTTFAPREGATGFGIHGLAAGLRRRSANQTRGAGLCPDSPGLRDVVRPPRRDGRRTRRRVQRGPQTPHRPRAASVVHQVVRQVVR